jgi:hypothetical protein
MQTLARLEHRGIEKGKVRRECGDRSRMAKVYKSSDKIPESGIYCVTHAQHRLPHEVTLIEGQTFPPCARCHDEVRFELVRELPALKQERRGSVSLYALPVLEEEEEDASR